MEEPVEAKGLKIAVSGLLSLSIILAVSLYFLYAAYSRSQDQLAAARRPVEQLTRQMAKSGAPRN
jgi:hypothetical protein